MFQCDRHNIECGRRWCPRYGHSPSHDGVERMRSALRRHRPLIVRRLANASVRSLETNMTTIYFVPNCDVFLMYIFMQRVTKINNLDTVCNVLFIMGFLTPRCIFTNV